MKYITDEYALNIPCSLNTTGDWHFSSFPLEKAPYYESNNTFYGDYGIEEHIINNKKYYIANHLRAILDLLIHNKFNYLIGFKDDFIVVNDYNKELFDLVYKLNNNDKWQEINNLMKNEYMLEWINYIKQRKDKYD